MTPIEEAVAAWLEKAEEDPAPWTSWQKAAAEAPPEPDVPAS